MVASAKGEVKELSFDDVMNAYDPVKRGFRKVEEMMKPEISPDIKPDIKLSPDMAKDIAGKGGPLPKNKTIKGGLYGFLWNTLYKKRRLLMVCTLLYWSYS